VSGLLVQPFFTTAGPDDSAIVPLVRIWSEPTTDRPPDVQNVPQH
jgi:hypothetical protein